MSEPSDFSQLPTGAKVLLWALLVIVALIGLPVLIWLVAHLWAWALSAW